MPMTAFIANTAPMQGRLACCEWGNVFAPQGEADESAQAAEQAHAEAAELLDRLRGRDGDVASVAASRDEALRRARSAGGSSLGAALLLTAMHAMPSMMGCVQDAGSMSCVLSLSCHARIFVLHLKASDTCKQGDSGGAASQPVQASRSVQ